MRNAWLLLPASTRPAAAPCCPRLRPVHSFPAASCSAAGCWLSPAIQLLGCCRCCCACMLRVPPNAGAAAPAAARAPAAHGCTARRCPTRLLHAQVLQPPAGAAAFRRSRHSLLAHPQQQHHASRPAAAHLHVRGAGADGCQRLAAAEVAVHLQHLLALLLGQEHVHRQVLEVALQRACGKQERRGARGRRRGASAARPRRRGKAAACGGCRSAPASTSPAAAAALP